MTNILRRLNLHTTSPKSSRTPKLASNLSHLSHNNKLTSQNSNTAIKSNIYKYTKSKLRKTFVPQLAKLGSNTRKRCEKSLAAQNTPKQLRMLLPTNSEQLKQREDFTNLTQPPIK